MLLRLIGSASRFPFLIIFIFGAVGILRHLVLNCKKLVIYDTEFKQIDSYFSIELSDIFILAKKLPVALLKTGFNFIDHGIILIVLIKGEHIVDVLHNGFRGWLAASNLEWILHEVFLVFLLEEFIVVGEEFVELVDVFVVLFMGGRACHFLAMILW